VRLLRHLRNQTGITRVFGIHWCCWLLAAGSILAPQAHAGFVGPYALGNFSLINTNADGTAVTNDGGLSVILTGGNNGSGIGGTTDLTITAAAGGVVHFQFSYSSLDDPAFDTAGFLLDGAYTQLAGTSGQTGVGNFVVAAGHTFGFRVETLDNQAEPGVFTVSDFTAPAATAGVPEPATWFLGFTALAAFGIARRRASAIRAVKEHSR
jgi:hypothetical protein